MSEDKYQIIIRSYEVADFLGLDPAVHHEIIFAKNGEPMLSFNGDAYNRQTGEIHFPSTSGQDTLRVRAMGVTIQDIDKEGEFPVVANTVLFEGNEQEMLSKLGQAAEASSFINAQNMDYVILGGPTFPGQNSNSVAYTLTHAMGLEVPPEVENLWAPGYGRLLLPNDWQSNIPTETENLFSYIKSNLEKLSVGNVMQQVRGDENPYYNYISMLDEESGNKPGQFFDPANPAIPQNDFKELPPPSQQNAMAPK